MCDMPKEWHENHHADLEKRVAQLERGGGKVKGGKRKKKARKRGRD